MVIAVLANDITKAELLEKALPSHIELVWADSVRSLTIIEADLYFDLLFELDRERIEKLTKLMPKKVVVSSVVHTRKAIGADFIRINAWPTMLSRNVWEIAGEGLPEELGVSFQLVPDITGMVTPRIISMIINEAWFTYGDGTSTKEEIDTAMRLGTNYPFGPFEWGDRIGLENIVGLLKALQQGDERYVTAPALLKEMNDDGVDFKY